MVETDKIREHMEVLGADGKHVGTVDEVEGDGRIRLTKSDRAANNMHHWMSFADVDRVDDAVHLRLPANDAFKNWSIY